MKLEHFDNSQLYLCHICLGDPRAPDDPEELRYDRGEFIRHMSAVHGYSFDHQTGEFTSLLSGEDPDHD